MSTTTLTDQEKHILWHSLGLHPSEPWKKPYRDYYATDPSNPELRAMVAKGLMREGAKIPGGLVYFIVTPEGRQAAEEAMPRMSRRKMRNKERYSRYLDAADAYPDLTFREFLKHEKEQAAAL